MKPRRSILSVPGHIEKMHIKACQSRADVVMLDLEDSVPVGAKESARETVVHSILSRDWQDKILTFRNFVLGIFLASSVMIGFVGCVLGLLLSLRFGYYINEIADFIYTLTGWHPFPPNVYYLDRIPWFTDWSEVVSVVLPTLVISFMVGLFPAWFGARSHPMESLRYE